MPNKEERQIETVARLGVWMDTANLPNLEMVVAGDWNMLLKGGLDRVDRNEEKGKK